MGTVVANGSAAEERAVGARQPVIVNGGHNGNPRIAAGIEHSRTEQGKRVMDVDDVGAVLAQHCFQITRGFAAPDGPGRKRRFLRQRPSLDLVAAAAEPHDLVSQGCERLALLVDDTVLSAGSTRAVAVVDKQDPHPGWVPSHHWRVSRTPSTREPAGRQDTSDGITLESGQRQQPGQPGRRRPGPQQQSSLRRYHTYAAADPLSGTAPLISFASKLSQVTI